MAVLVNADDNGLRELQLGHVREGKVCDSLARLTGKTDAYQQVHTNGERWARGGGGRVSDGQTSIQLGRGRETHQQAGGIEMRLVAVCVFALA